MGKHFKIRCSRAIFLVFSPAFFSASLVYLLFLNTRLTAQHHEIIFEKYGSVDLADWVRCMYQDSRGFLWIGTVDELVRFDGYTTVSYQPEPGDTNSISSNYIQCLHEDRAGMLWVGTYSNGLNKYNRYTDRFTRYQHDENDPVSISSNRINAVYEDKDENLWIGTSAGLNKLIRKNNRFICYKQDSSNINSSRDFITFIMEDDSRLLWLATHAGLYLFEKSPGKFYSFKEYFTLDDVFKTKSISLCYQDDSGVIWMGATGGLYQFIKDSNELFHYPIDTPESRPQFSNHIQTLADAGAYFWLGTTDGLYKFDKTEKAFTRYAHDAKNHLSLLENNITSVLKDKGGCFWFGLASKGVNKRNSIRSHVKYYFPNPFDSGSIEDRITSLHLSRSGKIWIGTHAYGFLCFDKRREEFLIFQHDPLNPNSLSSNDVRCVYEDRHGFVWIGTAEGLNKFEPKTGKFLHYSNAPEDANSLSYSGVMAIIEAANGSFYVGTYHGFTEFNPITGKFVRYLNDPENPQSISHNIILTIYEDSDHFIWIGTQGGGLNRFDPMTRRFTHYKNNPANPHSLGSNIVEAIYEFPYENRPTLWVGTQGGGLCRFDKETQQFYIFTKKDGLPDNRVQSMVADRHGNLWLTTIRCITRFDVSRGSFKNFEISSELPVNPHVCLMDEEGEIFFGGYRGLLRFFPDSMLNNKYLPNVVLTDFKVNNKSVRLDTVITERKSIVLSHRENIVSFEFAALDFSRSEFNQYAYRMESVDKDWVFTDWKRRYATYTGLAPGEYTFRVKGSNNDGVWNEEGASLKIIITPPWWQTWWAYSLYLTLLALTLYILRLYDLKRQRLKHQFELEHLHAQKLEELDRVKSHFFANISHEFRTPLTLILGPLEKLIAEAREIDLQQQYQVMRRSGQRLLNLINQLLDISKLESGSMTLRASCQDVVSLLRRIVNSFISLAERKHLTLEFKPADETIMAYVDQDKLEKIVNNLLSNAFKFTPAGGKVVVAMAVGREQRAEGEGLRAEGLKRPQPSALSIQRFKHGYVEIVVADTGVGILPDNIDKIFDRFYQVDSSQTRSYGGTGIGLALAKELVDLHHGEISVASERGMGTTFIVRLPLGKAHLAPEEIVETPSVESVPEELPAKWEDVIAPEIKAEERGTRRVKSAPILLVVEDNADMREYLCSLLSPCYRVFESVDGQDGLEKACRVIPDLIVSDVMMPQMDGFELCAKLKMDERTSHIPVILLTARASAESRIAGLETGADDYIAKPFEARELQARVKNLIDQRRKLRERFRKEAVLQPHEVAVTSTDEKFLQKALAVVEARMSDEEFSIEIFSREIGMSRVQLHRKLRALTGHSAGEFIRILRLNRAAQLLVQHGGNVTEVAYEVGFNNLSYFAKCFHQQFGVNPHTYAAGAHKSGSQE